ncbi:RDH10 dehydrogenase, partial [Polyodon spathula]|nr:RDH10 dehydrogenase [Polyodon spathula]
DYCARKFAVMEFHESLSHALRAHDSVKNTLVCPYIVDSGMFAGLNLLFYELELSNQPLKPDYCVQQAMKAMFINQPMICIPPLLYFAAMFKESASSLLVPNHLPPKRFKIRLVHFQQQ